MSPIHIGLLLLAINSVSEVPNPRELDSWVSDTADIFSAEEEANMNRLIDALHAETGVEIAVVTVHDVSVTPKEFSTGLFNDWGIGDAERNDGLLFLLVTEQRRLEMETGIGLDALLPSDWLQDMQELRMVPHFRGGRYGAGIEAGVDEVANRIRYGPAETESGVPVPEQAPVDSRRRQPSHQDDWPSESSGDTPWVPIGGGSLVSLVCGTWFYRRWRWKKWSTCAQCRITMLHLDEVSDDEHLGAGQQKEEELRSRNYHVFICGQCQDTKVRAITRWLSGYSKCGQCTYRTSKTTSTTLVHATYDHGGQVRVTTDCKHCGHHTERIRHTSRKTRPSSSSSSGGSSRRSSSRSSSRSFGGGRSRGGGAGSSW